MKKSLHGTNNSEVSHPSKKSVASNTFYSETLLPFLLRKPKTFRESQKFVKSIRERLLTVESHLKRLQNERDALLTALWGIREEEVVSTFPYSSLNPTANYPTAALQKEGDNFSPLDEITTTRTLIGSPTPSMWNYSSGLYSSYSLDCSSHNLKLSSINDGKRLETKQHILPCHLERAKQTKIAEITRKGITFEAFSCPQLCSIPGTQDPSKTEGFSDQLNAEETTTNITFIIRQYGERQKRKFEIEGPMESLKSNKSCELDDTLFKFEQEQTKAISNEPIVYPTSDITHNPKIDCPFEIDTPSLPITSSDVIVLTESPQNHIKPSPPLSFDNNPSCSTTNSNFDESNQVSDIKQILPKFSQKHKTSKTIDLEESDLPFDFSIFDWKNFSTEYLREWMSYFGMKGSVSGINRERIIKELSRISEYLNELQPPLITHDRDNRLLKVSTDEADSLGEHSINTQLHKAFISNDHIFELILSKKPLNLSELQHFIHKELGESIEKKSIKDYLKKAGVKYFTPNKNYTPIGLYLIKSRLDASK